MLRFLSKYGECDVTVDGVEVSKLLKWQEAKEGYDLVFDIMMPLQDGYQALKKSVKLKPRKYSSENRQNNHDYGLERWSKCYKSL